MHGFVKCLFRDMPTIFIETGSYLFNRHKAKKVGAFFRHGVIILIYVSVIMIVHVHALSCIQIISD